MAEKLDQLDDRDESPKRRYIYALDHDVFVSAGPVDGVTVVANYVVLHHDGFDYYYKACRSGDDAVHELAWEARVNGAGVLEMFQVASGAMVSLYAAQEWRRLKAPARGDGDELFLEALRTLPASD